MKYLLTCAALGALVASPVLAADLPARRVAPVAPVVSMPAYSFTGFYAGVSGGYGRESGSGKLAGPATHAGAFTQGDIYRPKRADGVVGGIQAGYNFQNGPLVLGIEADINTGLSSSKTKAKTASAQAPGSIDRDGRAVYSGNRLDWYGTVRPRIGLVAGERMMIYGTGGLAFGQVKSIKVGSGAAGNVITGSGSAMRTGWTLGGGVEYAILDNVSVRAEYDYVSLRGKNGRLAAGALPVAGRKNGMDFNVVRVGLNYKF